MSRRRQRFGWVLRLWLALSVVLAPAAASATPARAATTVVIERVEGGQRPDAPRQQFEALDPGIAEVRRSPPRDAAAPPERPRGLSVPLFLQHRALLR